MNKYVISYQLGINIFVTKIKAESMDQARYLFYMRYGAGADIRSIEEETDSD